MKNKLIIGGAIYILVLLSFTIFFVGKGNSNYFGYKKQIEVAKNRIKSNGSIKGEPKVTPQPTSTPQPSVTPQLSAAGSKSAELIYANVSFTRPLRKGVSGDDVKKLQELLIKNKMYNGSITGYFGSETEVALKKYQNFIKVTEDGVLGSSTWTRLLE